MTYNYDLETTLLSSNQLINNLINQLINHLVDSPSGIQFNHWRNPKDPVSPLKFNYSQIYNWKQFAACLWIKSTYKQRQVIFSYKLVLT